MQKLRKLCHQRDIPLISPATEHYLCEQMEKIRPQHVLEIGTAIGYSSICMAQHLRERGGKITSFEISTPAYQEAYRNYIDYGINNRLPHMITSYNMDILGVDLSTILFDTCFDFVFIDAQKSKYKEYLLAIQPYISHTTIIIIDDVIKFADKMQNLYDFLRIAKIEYTCMPLDKDDGVMRIENGKNL